MFILLQYKDVSPSLYPYFSIKMLLYYIHNYFENLLNYEHEDTPYIWGDVLQNSEIRLITKTYSLRLILCELV